MLGMGEINASLKRGNAPVLWAILGADALLLFLVFNEFSWPAGRELSFLVIRVGASLILPAAALLLSAAVPASVKDVLVFWRYPHALPGHRAFSQIAHRDPRIDVERLRTNVKVEFPSEPVAQNKLWYRLFKKVEGEASIQHENRIFLLLREVASISLVGALGSTAWWLFAGSAIRTELGPATVLLTVQYLLAALGSANSGRRLVASVLAAHGLKQRR